MSRKIFGKNSQKNMQEVAVTSFGDVARGESEFKLDNLKETNVVNGEIPFLFTNFDVAVNLGKARIVGDHSAYGSDSTVNSAKHSVSDYRLPPLEREEPQGFSETVFTEEAVDTGNSAISDEKLQSMLSEEREKGYNEGYVKGLEDGAEKSKKEYMKEQSDYLELLKGAYNEVISRSKAFDAAVGDMDSALPELLTRFLETLIGTERKINSKLIVAIIKKSLKNLHDLSHVVFRVNPDDLAAVKKAYPDYESEADPSIGRGGLKINTNIGEMDYTIETMTKNFMKLIYEELESTDTN